MADAHMTNLPFTPLPPDAGGDRILRIPCVGPYYEELLDGVPVSRVQLQERPDGLHDLVLTNASFPRSPLTELFAFAFGQAHEGAATEAEPDSPDRIRLEAEAAAARSPQPGDWGRRWYMSVTGLRCRSCHSLFEDGEHAYWCPA